MFLYFILLYFTFVTFVCAKETRVQTMIYIDLYFFEIV